MLYLVFVIECFMQLHLSCLQVFTYDKVAMARESTGHERRRGLLPPFEKLMQENEIAEDDLSDKDTEDIFLPDVRSLLHVTNRRKINVNATDSSLVCILFTFSL